MSRRRLSRADRSVGGGFLAARMRPVGVCTIKTYGLGFQLLEPRTVMATIPVLNSLPGAAKSLFLDFDGDVQQVWHRTDNVQQTYTNVTAGQFNLDHTAGFSNAEASAMKKIWAIVADDYAPFNINVTTVAPPSFANDVAVRVVMCGDTTAKLTTGATSVTVSGDRFIANDNGATLANNSGYSSIGSFSDGEPNVVYVFAKYINTWPTVDSEHRTCDLQYVMATTASHEAGHAFGLVHDPGPGGYGYSVGTDITTPIMGSNAQGDRTIWSSYTAGSTPHDNVQELTNKLGARPDDFGDSYLTANTLRLTSPGNTVAKPSSVTVKGIISTSSDADWFRFTSSGGTYNFSIDTPQFANLDSRLEVYRIDSLPFVTIPRLIASSDPSIPTSNPFSGLGASLSLSLVAGSYAVAVKSHGGYGDLGNYTLGIVHPFNPVVNPVSLLAAQFVDATGEQTTNKPPLVPALRGRGAAVHQPATAGRAG